MVGKKNKGKRRRVLRGGLDPNPPAEGNGLPTLAEIEAWKRCLRQETCSEPWVEARVYRNEPYPPPCDHPNRATFRGMVRCRGCRRWIPPVCVVSSGHCDDCHLGAMSPWALARLPSSRTGIAMRLIRRFKLKPQFPESKLASDPDSTMMGDETEDGHTS